MKPLFTFFLVLCLCLSSLAMAAPSNVHTTLEVAQIDINSTATGSNTVLSAGINGQILDVRIIVPKLIHHNPMLGGIGVAPTPSSGTLWVNDTWPISEPIAKFTMTAGNQSEYITSGDGFLMTLFGYPVTGPLTVNIVGADPNLTTQVFVFYR